MSESLIPDGIEAENADSRRLSSDLAASYALREAWKNSSGHEAAADFLISHKNLVDRQFGHLIEEYHIAHRAAHVKHISDILRIVAQAAFIVVGIGVASGVVAMWWSAISSNAVVVNAFASPASLADSGLTGTVVASKVLNELLKIQDGTKFAAARRQVKDAWSSSIEVKLPESGISLNEINNALHRTFGHDIYIDGALTRTKDNMLALSIRGDDIPPTMFRGGEDDIDGLARKAAEYAYGYAQPALFASYLIGSGRRKTAYPSSARLTPARATRTGPAWPIFGARRRCL